MIYEMTVSQFLPFLEPGATSSIEGEVVSQSLEMTETITISKKRQSISQHMNIGQTIIRRLAKRNLHISQTLAMWGRPSHGTTRTVTQVFPMWQKARPVKYKIVTQTIHLTQTISNYKFHGIYQALNITQVIRTTIRRNLTLAQTLALVANQNAYQAKRDDCYVAHPYTLGGPNGSPSYEF